MLKHSTQKLCDFFLAGNKKGFLLELEIVENRTQLNKHEIYNTLKARMSRSDWPELKRWLNSDMSENGGEE